MQALAPLLKRMAPFVASIAIAGTGVGYAVHEHHTAQGLAVQNEQVSAALAATHNQLNDLAARVNALASRDATPPASPTTVSVATAPARRTAKPSAAHLQDRRLIKLQAQLDAEGKQIDETRSDLANTRTELTGSIAHTHDELVLLEKKGERNYTEFDLGKSKQFRREGPISISLRKANEKHQYADLQLIVEDRNLVQKHVNVYQPVVFYSDKEQPIQVVINEVSKDHIHGYVSAPKYGQGELTSMLDAGTNPVGGLEAPANAAVQPAPRKKLPLLPQPQ
ncbi:MAG: hypothetical protein WBE76_19345 [Terracidiphilus sp.]